MLVKALTHILQILILGYGNKVPFLLRISSTLNICDFVNFCFFNIVVIMIQ
mgnify:CR=1 FL=1